MKTKTEDQLAVWQVPQTQRRMASLTLTTEQLIIICNRKALDKCVDLQPICWTKQLLQDNLLHGIWPLHLPA